MGSDVGLNNWVEDRLNRRELADHLTDALLSLGGGAGVTIALDADWGAGKSFFVNCWSKDLRDSGYGVVFFDAWENDIGDEPAFALMASISEGLVSYSKVAGIKDKAEGAAKSLGKVVLLPAAVNVAKVLGKGLLRKAIGVDTGELLEAVGCNQEDVSDAVDDTLDDVAERFSSEIVEIMGRRRALVSEFKSKLADLASVAKEKPYCFIFIDELDRCRPSYALKLLEGVKHFFSVPGVIFVFSTNMGQLRHIVTKEYGDGFDGKRYLNRFFDREYRLPMPSLGGGIASWPELVVIDKKFGNHIIAGVPEEHGVGVSGFWPKIAVACFGSDIRIQKKALGLVGEVVPVIVERFGTCHFAWLSFLCCMYYLDLDLLGEMSSPGYAYGRDMNFFVSRMRGEDHAFRFSYFSDDDYMRRNRQDRSVKISEVIGAYYSECSQVRQGAYERNRGAYPKSLLCRDYNNIDEYINDRGRSPFYEYVNVVFMAGRLLPRSDDD